jgi:glucarate dehydratase
MNNTLLVVTKMQVFPVAGYDSMLLTVTGAHAPFFTRNLVILMDSAGHTGVGEVHGGDAITKALNEYIPLVVGREIGQYRSVIQSLKRIHEKSARNSEGLQNLSLANLKDVVHAETAVEAALLDLLGQFLELPVCELLGDGRQREDITVLGYLFYQADGKKTGLPYMDENDHSNPWFAQRRKPALTPEAIVE